MEDIRDKIPENFNPLYADKFKFVLLNAKRTTFFCSGANLPGVSITDIDVHNPVNKFFVAGNKLNYEPFTMAFRVDEDLSNYQELLRWMKGITGPEDTDQHKDFITNHNYIGSKPTYNNIFNDGTLVALNNNSVSNINIVFKDMFPISLSGLDLDLTNSNTIQASVSFRFNYYEVETNT